MSRIVQTLPCICILLFMSAPFAQPDSSSNARPDTMPSPKGRFAGDTSSGFDKVVVTGTRTPRTIRDNPANVTVITRSQIESSAATNVSDLLMYEPGVIVKRPVGMAEGVPSDIDMRGVPGATAATRTLVLVDGIPTNAAGTPFLIINEIPMDAIERVEIVRGPYSTLYGPNAFGGVVNIITKSPGKDVHGEIGGGGFKNFYDAGGDLSGSTGRFSYLVDGALRGIGNYYGTDSVSHRFGNNYRMSNADNYGYYDRRFFGKFNYALSSRAVLTLNTRYFDSDLGFGRSEFGNPPAEINVLGQKILVGPVLRVNVSPSLDVRIGGYFRNLRGTFYDLGIRADSTHDTVQSMWKSSSNDWQVDGQSTLKLGKNNTLTAGFDVLDNSIYFGPRLDATTGDYLKDAYSDDKAMQNAGAYVQDELKFGRIISTAALRLDYNSIFGFVPCPRLGLIYKQNDKLRLKFSIGRAFRAPSLGELFLPDMPINTSTTLRANPDLRPEYIWAVDGGPEFDVTKWANVRISGFYNSMDDLIGQQIINQGFQGITENAFLSHKNISRAWSAGAEGSLEIRLWHWGNYFLNYTYTKSRDMEMLGNLEYIPEHQFNTGVYFKKSMDRFAFTGSVMENFVGARDYLDWIATLQDTSMPLPLTPSDFKPTYLTLSQYFRTDVSLKITYNDFVWLGIDGLNIFNARIEEQSGTYAPVRFVEAKIGVKF